MLFVGWALKMSQTYSFHSRSSLLFKVFLTKCIKQIEYFAMSESKIMRKPIERKRQRSDRSLPRLNNHPDTKDSNE